MALTDHERAALDDLRGKVCRACGGSKDRGKFFCRRCFFSLPIPARVALRTHIMRGGAKIYFAIGAELERRREKRIL